MYPCTCMPVILQTNSNTHFYLSRRSTRLTVHIAFLVGPVGDVRVVYSMVNGYANINKENRKKKNI